jgi:hypothetical protein
VEDEAGEPVLVGLEDVRDGGEIVDGGIALVVDHDVEVLCPVGLLIDGVELLLALILFDFVEGDGHLDIGALGQAFGQDVLLMGVVVTAAAADEQDADGLGGGFVVGARDGGEDQGDGESAYGSDVPVPAHRKVLSVV